LSSAGNGESSSASRPDAAGYENAIKLIESGKFPLEKMQTHKFGLDDVEHAIKLLAGEVPGEDGIHVAIMPGR